MLEYFEHGDKIYIDFENERFFDKTKALSDAFKAVLLPWFRLKSKKSSKSEPSKEKFKAKLQEIAQKQVDNAKSQFISMAEILQFDLVPSVLFEGNFTVKPEEHLLTAELEKLFYQHSIIL